MMSHILHPLFITVSASQKKNVALVQTLFILPRFILLCQALQVHVTAGHQISTTVSLYY